MRALAFYFCLPFIYLLSILPFRVLYGLSDFIYFMLYHVLKYRRKVVSENLRNSFPEKSKAELKKIEQEFYSYLCDLIVETIKTLTISKKEALARFKINDNFLFEKLYAEKKNIILVMGHLGNWEWARLSLSLSSNFQLYGIYKPLSNKYFNQFMYKMRSRFGTKLIAMNDTYREMLKNKNEMNITAFIADQTPSPDNAYWTSFMNQETPIFRGTEKIAQKLNYAVVFANINRRKRGYYEASAELLFEYPKLTAAGVISEAHTRHLEQEIIKQPEIWLWSHRRWKHKKTE